MSRMRDFKLPDLGEGLTEGEILQWLVSPGDEVKLNQPIVEVETAKAAVEVPSPFAGVVTRLHHEAGSTVDVGSVIITFDTDPSAGPLEEAAAVQAAGAAANPAESAAAAGQAGDRRVAADGMVPSVLIDNPPDEGAVEPGLIGGPAPGGRTSVLVGYGPRSTSAKRRPRSGANGGEAAAALPTPGDLPAPNSAREAGRAVGARAAAAGGGVSVLAKPPVRKLARDLGVDLTALTGTGPAGSVTRADVEAAAAGRSAAPAPASLHALPAYDPATRERRIPIKGVRKHSAAAVSQSAFTAPHVTEFVTIDMTPTMELRSRVQALPEFAGLKVTPLLFVAKALLLAVKRHPEINATWDEAAGEIIVKDYVNLGIAAATPRGLIVPNIKDADALTLPQLAQAIAALTATAKEGKTPPADMQRGTITITNVGVFGVDNGTPILNPGESAILCFGAVRPMPWVVDGEIVVRQVTQLALSFDHRNVDGQLGSEFLADIARVLSDPATALLWS